jgi:AcrR family transcriptional regulator
MPSVAQAAGIGVGSLYRLYGSKGDLIAAIVVQQMAALRAEVARASREEDAGEALERTLRQLVDRQATNELLRAALAATSDRRDVQLAVGELSLAWQELLDRARRQGSVRGDVTVGDLRLIFAAAGAADQVEQGGRERILELLLEAMRRPRRGGR